MKKLLFLAICFFAVGSASAQTYYYGHPHHKSAQRRIDDFYKLRIGITGGMNVANTIDIHNEYYGTASLIGFNAGLAITIPVAYPLSLQLEGLYSQKGYKAYGQYGDFTQHNNYIDVPLLLNFEIARGFHFLIGAQGYFPGE